MQGKVRLSLPASILQDPFDPDEFVERMVRRSMAETRLKDDQFDPEMIHDIFTQAIQDLRVILFLIVFDVLIAKQCNCIISYSDVAFFKRSSA